MDRWGSAQVRQLLLRAQGGGGEREQREEKGGGGRDGMRERGREREGESEWERGGRGGRETGSLRPAVFREGFLAEERI